MNNYATLPAPFADTIAAYLRALLGANRSDMTITSYRADLLAFALWLTENTLVTAPAEVDRGDIAEYLAELGHARLTGLTRARKLAAIKGYYRHLVDVGTVAASPAEAVGTPKREKRSRSYLSQEAYSQLLAQAAGTPRDLAILQTFLQTGIRVSELVGLTLDDVDLAAGMLHVRGKGLKDRTVPLATKVVKALKLWTTARPKVDSRVLFLNRYDQPISVRGVQKLVNCYKHRAGLTKDVTPHSLRHTYATQKASKGVGAFQLRDFMGHASVATTQIYVHLGEQEAKRVQEATSL